MDYIFGIIFLFLCVGLIFTIHRYQAGRERYQSAYDKYKALKADLETIAKESEERQDAIAENLKDNYTLLEEMSQDSFDNYCLVMNQKYKDAEEETEKLFEELAEHYCQKQEQLDAEISKIETQLEEMKSKRAAVLEAQRKEREESFDLKDRRIKVSESDIQDIKRLEKLKPELNNPRSLCKLIWSDYYMKPLKQLSLNTLGSSAVTGIYKLTNLLTNEVYIGQARDVAKRWTEHVKAGTGIDTPAHHKLYENMLKYGVWNFAFELLEKCTSAELNEREAFYIDYFQSKEYGLNSISGIRKK